MPGTDLRITCPQCGATNRVSGERVARGDAAVCGRCKNPLPLPAGWGEVTVVSDGTFGAVAEGAAGVVVVDLWAPWCGPCRMIAPIVETLAREFAGRAQFMKLNIDENPATAARFRVDSIPTLLLLRAGREVDRIVGVAPAPEIRRRVAALLGA